MEIIYHKQLPFFHRGVLPRKKGLHIGIDDLTVIKQFYTSCSSVIKIDHVFHSNAKSAMIVFNHYRFFPFINMQMFIHFSSI